MYHFKIFTPYQNQLTHGFTTKGEGNFKESQSDFQPSINQLKEKTGIKQPVTTTQIHTDEIMVASEYFNDTPAADALITNTKNLPIMVKVADCQAVLMFDPITQSIAAIHSGWKGSCVNIIGKTVSKMQQEFGVDPKNLLVAISPSLGPCCCKFSDPKKELPTFVHPYSKENNHVDFWALSIDQLKEAGVTEDHIEESRQCTQCNPDKYYSYRNGNAERMGAFISLL